jgi:hypothetical protein
MVRGSRPRRDGQRFVAQPGRETHERSRCPPTQPARGTSTWWASVRTVVTERWGPGRDEQQDAELFGVHRWFLLGCPEGTWRRHRCRRSTAGETRGTTRAGGGAAGSRGAPDGAVRSSDDRGPSVGGVADAPCRRIATEAAVRDACTRHDGGVLDGCGDGRHRRLLPVVVGVLLGRVPRYVTGTGPGRGRDPLTARCALRALPDLGPGGRPRSRCAGCPTARAIRGRPTARR